MHIAIQSNFEDFFLQKLRIFVNNIFEFIVRKLEIKKKVSIALN